MGVCVVVWVHFYRRCLHRRGHKANEWICTQRADGRDGRAGLAGVTALCQAVPDLAAQLRVATMGGEVCVCGGLILSAGRREAPNNVWLKKLPRPSAPLDRATCSPGVRWSPACSISPGHAVEEGRITHVGRPGNDTNFEINACRNEGPSKKREALFCSDPTMSHDE